MKKKSLLMVVVVLCMFVHPCSAGVTSLVWQRDLSDEAYVSNHDFSMWHFIDGSVAVLAVELPNTYRGTLLVYESNGDLRYKNSLSLSTSYSIKGVYGIASDPSHIFVHISISGNEMYEVYTRQSEGYTSGYTSNYQNEFYWNFSKAGADPRIGFVVSGTRLYKLRLGSEAVVLEDAVASGIDGSNYILNWGSKVGIPYQIQSSTNLVDWIDIGIPMLGTGSSLTWANALTNSKSFFRVIEK